MLQRFNDGTACGQRLDSVNEAHQVLACGKLVLQKINKIFSFNSVSRFTLKQLVFLLEKLITLSL